jgi:hypothetical protein
MTGVARTAFALVAAARRRPGCTLKTAKRSSGRTLTRATPP